MTTCPSHPVRRILLVENDPDVRETLAEFLKLRGYEVFTVREGKDSLVAQAQTLVASERIHLAILDVRLQNDNDVNDVSGYELAKWLTEKYPRVVRLFYSGYKDAARLLVAYEYKLIFKYVPKEEGARKLLHTVEQVFAEEIPCRWDQTLEGIKKLIEHNALVPLANMTERSLGQDDLCEEFVELIGRLFQDAERVRLEPLVYSWQDLAVRSSHSLLLRATALRRGSWSVPVVVKIGTIQNIERESENYEAYVHHMISGNRHTKRDDTQYTWHLGGITYSFFGPELQRMSTLEQIYSDYDNAVGDLNLILTDLFKVVFRNWYSEARFNPHRVADAYRKGLSFDDRRLEQLDWGTQDVLEHYALKRPAPHPLRWYHEYEAASHLDAHEHIVHGDLHSRNVFVGPNNDVWLIDFERTGQGHALRDFVEMETDIKYSLLKMQKDEHELFARFELALLGQDVSSLRQKNLLPPLQVRQHADADRAFRTITLLRKFALDKIMYPDLRDYFWGLLVQTLYVATLPDLSDEARERTKLAAALLCARLGNGKKLKPIRQVERLLTPPAKRRGSRRQDMLS